MDFEVVVAIAFAVHAVAIILLMVAALSIKKDQIELEQRVNHIELRVRVTEDVVLEMNKEGR